jgi:hypothetical protein
LLARIAAGQNQNEASLANGFDWLRAHPPNLTYEVGLVLMAFDARAAPVGERLLLEKASADELLKYAFPRTLEPRDRDYLQPLIDRLSSERFKECWSYGGAAPTTADMSNTQYAVLGLKAASRLGLNVDRKLFADVLVYFLEQQQPHARKVTYVDVQPSADGEPHRYVRIVEPRGFGCTYGTRDGPELIASQACIDIACVALDSALAWLDQNWAVDRHPPGIPGQGSDYRFLYALEQAGALTSRRSVDEHD